MRKINYIYVILFTGLPFMGAICAPRPCAGGLDAYVLYGVFGALVTLILPFFKKELPLSKRILYALAFSLLLIVLWILLLFSCNFQLLCRLF